MSRPPVPRLMVITDPQAPGGVVSGIRQALAGVPTAEECDKRESGTPVPPVVVQLRDKGASGRRLVELGRALREVTREAGVSLVVNGRVDVARIVEADGVHLPEDGLPAREARAVLGTSALVGCSCHDAEGLARAADEGADYATLGPLRSVPGKGPALGTERFAALAAKARLPILALGGVGPSEVPEALEAGARGVAVIRAVRDVADPAAALADLLRILDRPRGEGE